MASILPDTFINCSFAQNRSRARQVQWIFLEFAAPLLHRDRGRGAVLPQISKEALPGWDQQLHSAGKL
jgi:hypothetical protein